MPRAKPPAPAKAPDPGRAVRTIAELDKWYAHLRRECVTLLMHQQYDAVDVALQEIRYRNHLAAGQVDQL